MQKYSKYKRQLYKDQQTIKSLDILYRKNLQDKVIDKSEYDCLCKIFIEYVNEKKMKL